MTIFATKREKEARRQRIRLVCWRQRRRQRNRRWRGGRGILVVLLDNDDYRLRKALWPGEGSNARDSKRPDDGVGRKMMMRGWGGGGYVGRGGTSGTSGTRIATSITTRIATRAATRRRLFGRGRDWSLLRRRRSDEEYGSRRRWRRRRKDNDN
jgi:hypothetical protein